MQEYKAAPAGPYLPPSSIWAPFPTSPYGRRAHLISAADAPKQPHAPPPPPATAEICRDGGNSSNEFARSRRRRRRRRLISRWPAAQGNPFLPSFLPSRLSVDRSFVVRPSVRPRSSRSFCRVIVLALLTCENFGQSAPAAPLRNESTQISTERNPPSPRYFLHCSTPTAFNLNRMLELLSRAKLQSCFPATFHSLPGMTFH